MTTEPLPAGVGPAQLSGALRRAGALSGEASVREIAVESARSTILSRIFRLRLGYDCLAPDAPTSIILKTALPERSGSEWNAGRREVAFYNDVASTMPVRLVPRCFEAHWDAETEAWRLLLEDLTETHYIATTWPLPPTMGQCAKIVERRARFHAAWWDDPRLGTTVGAARDADSINNLVQAFAGRLARFCDRIGDGLSPERRGFYERLLAVAPDLLARRASRPHHTIVQGDAHVWNCFLPRDGSDDIRFFDWDSWRIGIGSDDLAYMMAIHWYPDLRHRFEPTLLDHYHTRLLALGVRGYDRSTLDDDYRLSVLWRSTTPIWQATSNIPPVIWRNNMERVLLAVDDLGCRDLLG